MIYHYMQIFVCKHNSMCKMNYYKYRLLTELSKCKQEASTSTKETRKYLQIKCLVIRRCQTLSQS